MPEVGQPIKADQPPLWEYRRDDGSGWTDHVRLDVDDLGQIVLSVLNDHDEWDEVVLDPPAAEQLGLALLDAVRLTPQEPADRG